MKAKLVANRERERERERLSAGRNTSRQTNKRTETQRKDVEPRDIDFSPLSNRKTFILPEVFFEVVIFSFSDVWKRRAALIDGLPGDGEEKANWPTFVTSPQSRNSDHDHIRYSGKTPPPPHPNRRRANVGQPGLPPSSHHCCCVHKINPLQQHVRQMDVALGGAQRYQKETRYTKV